MPIESVRHATHALLQLGEHVEVLDPPALRDAIESAARGLLARYEASRPNGSANDHLPA